MNSESQHWKPHWGRNDIILQKATLYLKNHLLLKHLIESIACVTMNFHNYLVISQLETRSGLSSKTDSTFVVYSIQSVLFIHIQCITYIIKMVTNLKRPIIINSMTRHIQHLSWEKADLLHVYQNIWTKYIYIYIRYNLASICYIRWLFSRLTMFLLQH